MGASFFYVVNSEKERENCKVCNRKDGTCGCANKGKGNK